MRIFFSVGEPSGDLHAANLIRQLLARDPNLECVGLGGPKMAAVGCRLLADMTSLAVMFLAQVVAKVPRFWRLLREADRYFANHAVDAVVLVDFPGFNWLIARRAKARGIPVFYYGVPQLWAWAPWRVKKMRRLIDYAICKLPFEPDWFQRRGCSAHFVGHPFFDQLAQQQQDVSFIRELRSDARPLLLLLPGSRDQEVDKHWPVLRETALKCLYRHHDLRIVVGCFRDNQYRQVAADIERMKLPIRAYVDRTPDLMRAADICLACSGSVSLELMYHQLPSVIVYKVSTIANWLQTIFLHCRYITLVNLMANGLLERTERRAYDPDAAGAEAVPIPEYLTNTDRTDDMARRLVAWLDDPQMRATQSAWLGRLREKYAQVGASGRAADFVLDRLNRHVRNVRSEAA